MTTSGELHGYAKAMRREMTPAEQLLWTKLRNRKLMGTKFRRQHPFGRFILDFYAVEVLLAIEADGAIHDTESNCAYDAWRDETIGAVNILILRFTNTEIETDLATVLATIMKTIATRRQALDDRPHPLPLSREVRGASALNDPDPSNQGNHASLE